MNTLQQQQQKQQQRYKRSLDLSYWKESGVVSPGLWLALKKRWRNCERRVGLYNVHLQLWPRQETRDAAGKRGWAALEWGSGSTCLTSAANSSAVKRTIWMQLCPSDYGLACSASVCVSVEECVWLCETEKEWERERKGARERELIYESIRREQGQQKNSDAQITSDYCACGNVWGISINHVSLSGLKAILLLALFILLKENTQSLVLLSTGPPQPAGS